MLRRICRRQFLGSLEQFRSEFAIFGNTDPIPAAVTRAQCGSCVPLVGCTAEPLKSRLSIGRASVARTKAFSLLELGTNVAQLGRSAIVFRGESLVLLSREAVFVGDTELERFLRSLSLCGADDALSTVAGPPLSCTAQSTRSRNGRRRPLFLLRRADPLFGHGPKSPQTLS